MQKIFYAVLVFAALILNGCKKEDNPVAAPPSTFIAPAIKSGEAYISGTKVSVYSYDSLKVGYRTLYFQALDSATGKTASNVRISIIPMMQMMSMAHSSPFRQVDSLTTNGFYSGAVVFIMPGSSMEYWYLNVTVDNKNTGKKETQMLRLNSVGSSSEAAVMTGTDSAKYVVCMHPITKPGVGINDITFSIYKRESMMSFPGINDCTIEMVPDMPSMGHSSPNNVNPVSTANGMYTGKVNFTMTGEWRLTVKVKRGTTELLTKEFFITL